MMGTMAISAVRAQGGREGSATRPFPPLKQDHPLVDVSECAACGRIFQAGDVTAPVVLGPGADVEAQKKAARGGWYSAVAVILHAECAGLNVGDT